MSFTNSLLQPETCTTAHTDTHCVRTDTLKHTLLHAFHSKMLLQIFCCIMLQHPPVLMLLSHSNKWHNQLLCTWLDSHLHVCAHSCRCVRCVYMICNCVSWRDTNMKQALTLSAELKQKKKKNMRLPASWRPSQALLIYDVIFRLGYIFDASYLSSLILSENSGCVCQPLCT